jgi:hypothetical protein
MRVGQNPAKNIETVAHPQRITVAVLTYIPFLGGFYAEMPRVLKTSLASLRQTADLPFDLMVFDNGSCAEVREYLQSEQAAGRIQYLVLSEKNLGKGGAWNVIFGGAPGEIIAYADSDVLFHPGWLSRSVQILETFPSTGMVAARPFRTDPALFSSTRLWASKDLEAVIETGSFVPWEVFREFDVSLGQSEEQVRSRYESTEDVRITFRGLQVYAGASHWQFVARKQTLGQFLPFDMSRPMGQVKQLDQRINEAGLLRLMLTDPMVRHMGNTLRGLDGTPPSLATVKPPRRRIVDLPPVRRFLMRLHHRIFKLYFDR